MVVDALSGMPKVNSLSSMELTRKLLEKFAASISMTQRRERGALFATQLHKNDLALSIPFELALQPMFTPRGHMPIAL